MKTLKIAEIKRLLEEHKKYQENREMPLADFSYSKIKPFNFDELDLSCARFSQESEPITGRNHMRHFRGADFTNTHVAGSTFIKANLRGVCFFNANLSDCDFTDSNLIGADLRHAHIRYADFSGSNMRIYIDKQWAAFIDPLYIRIGCQFHLVKTWNKFTNTQIQDMAYGALDYWKSNKKIIMTIHKQIIKELHENN